MNLNVQAQRNNGLALHKMKQRKLWKNNNKKEIYWTSNIWEAKWEHLNFEQDIYIPLHSEGGGAGKWTINGFVCKFIYKNRDQVVYFTDLPTCTCYRFKICICTRMFIPHPLCMALRSKDNMKMPYFCELDVMTQFSGWCSYCGNKDSRNVTQGVTTEPPQQLFSYFFILQRAGTAGWGRSLRPPSFFAIVLHAGDGISQLTWVSWKKKKEN